MSDTFLTSQAAGQPLPQAAGEPAGAAPPAPAPVAEPTSSVTPPATSGAPPAQGTSQPAPPKTFSDLEKEYFAEAEAAAHNQQQTPPPQPQQPQQPQPEAQAPPEPQAPPQAQQQPEAPPSEPQVEDPEPSPAEQQEGKAPVKKLIRALKDRREFKTQAETYQRELAQERVLTNGVLKAFSAAGLTADKVVPFISSLARARTDPAAQQLLLQQLGIQPAPAPAPVDLKALAQHLDAYDIDAAKAMLAPLIQGPPAQQPPQQQAPPVQPPAPPAPPPTPPVDADLANNPLIQAVAIMGQTLRATYGQQEAARLAGLIDQTAKAEIERLESLDLEVTPKSAAKVWQDAQGKVLAAHRQAQPQAPRPPQQNLRPQTHIPQQPVQPKKADDLFREGAWR